MRPFNEWVLKTEAKLDQEDIECGNELYSLVRLHREIEPFGRFLDNLNDIHVKCTLDYNAHPGEPDYYKN